MMETGRVNNELSRLDGCGMMDTSEYTHAYNTRTNQKETSCGMDHHEPQ